MSCFSTFVHSIVQNAVHLCEHHVVSRTEVELFQLNGEFVVKRLVCFVGCDDVPCVIRHFRHFLYLIVDVAVHIFCGRLDVADSLCKHGVDVLVCFLHLLRNLYLYLSIANDAEEIEHGIYVVDGTIKLQQRRFIVRTEKVLLFHVGFHLAQIAQGILHKHLHLLLRNFHFVTQLLFDVIHSGLCIRHKIFQIVNLVFKHHLGILEQCDDDMVEQSMKRLQLEHFLCRRYGTVHRIIHLNTADLNVLQVLIEAEDVLCHTSRIKQECCRAFFIEPFIAGIIV